jgi:plastocyanin
MRAPVAAVATALAALALAAPATAETTFVSVQHSTFSPASLDVLVGDAVSWRNVSLREHDVTSAAAGFESGRLARNATFAHTFAAPGAFPYICKIHAGMSGHVAVHPLLLEGPTAPVARGTPVALHVRAPAGAGEVTIEEDAGGGFRRVATATAAAGGGHADHDGPGTLHATVTPAASASYRAVAAAGTSPTIRVEVSDRTAMSLTSSARPGGATLAVRSVPAQPGARVALQLRLRERFGWWTVARARLDGRSRARFTLRRQRPVRVRVVLVGRDGTTVITASRPLVVRPGRAP